VRKMRSFKRHALKIILLVIVPVILGLIVCDIYIMNAIFHTNVKENYSARLVSTGQRVESDLKTIEEYMNAFMSVVEGSDFTFLSMQSDEILLFESSQRVLERYRSMMSINEHLTGFLIYSQVNDYYRIIENRNSGYVSSPAMLDYLKEHIAAAGRGPNGWFTGQVDGRRYLLRIVRLGKAYQMCFIDEEKYLAALSGLLDTGAGEKLRFDPEETHGQPFAITRTNGYRQIQLCYHSEGLFAPLVMEADYVIQMLPAQAAIMMMTLLMLLALVPIGIVAFRQTLLKPIERLGEGIARVRSGDMEAKIDYQGTVEEYAQLSRTFNEMTEEITRLTIQRYEQRLEVQRTELQYLHLQIRPHFYLNCLKIVYSLAQCRDYATIQKLILLLSDYLRGIWRNASSVTLEEEIHHVATFVELNNLCNKEKVRCDIQVDKTANDFALPPLLALTFVENAIKHARVAEKELHVSLRAHVLQTEDGRYLNMTITDDGPGFTPEQLEVLNAPQPKESPGHVGIYNVRERLQLIYEGRASITFMSTGGAAVEIFLPYPQQEEDVKA